MNSKPSSSDVMSDTEAPRSVSIKGGVSKWSLSRGLYHFSEYHVTKDKRGPVSLKSRDCLVVRLDSLKKPREIQDVFCASV